MEKARLDKIIAGEGTYSRREVRLLVRQGRVLVDGVPARSPEDKVVPEAVEIMVDGTGMCGACRITVGGKTKFVCVDGPEFDAHQVDFDEMLMRLGAYKDIEKK